MGICDEQDTARPQGSSEKTLRHLRAATVGGTEVKQIILLTSNYDCGRGFKGEGRKRPRDV